MNYTTACQTLNNRTSRKLENHTYLKRIDDHTIGVLLHDTFVVKFTPQYIELNSGGWRTPTTKDRINKYGSCDVTQRNSIWYLDTDQALFQDGMHLHPETGRVLNPIRGDQITAHEKKVREMKRKIAKFARYATEQVRNGIGVPSAGDCWYCMMKTEEKQTLGDAIEDTSHLFAHMKEKYVVPALVWNAVAECGYRFPEVIIGFDPETQRSGSGMFLERSVYSAIVKYMQKRLLKGLL